jgi:8-oxo-dGTP pyrophosphatase MutT (NUDIX family)
VSEETGLEIQAEMFLTTSHFYRGGVQPDNEVVGVIFGCSTADGSELRLSDEHSTHRWVTVKEAADLLSSEHRLILLLTRADLARRLMPRELRDLRSLPAEQWGLRSPGGL